MYVKSRGILDILKRVFTYCTKQTRKEALWLVSNIAANSDRDSEAIVDSQLMINLLCACRDSAYELRKEAIWVLSNIIHRISDKERVEKLVEMDVMSTLIELLQRDSDSGTISSLGLNAVNQLLTRSDQAKFAFMKLGGEDVALDL